MLLRFVDAGHGDAGKGITERNIASQKPFVHGNSGKVLLQIMLPNLIAHHHCNVQDALGVLLATSVGP